MTVGPKISPAQDHRFLGHPVGLFTLFTTELWERFSYYGLRAILVLYLAAPESSGGLGMSVGESVAIYGVYSSMVYLLSVPGGWISDRMWGPRKTVLVGAFIIAGGHYVMAIPMAWSVWPGLVFIALGTGLLKPNISAMVGGLYDGDTDDGVRRDSGFSIYYMGINVGGFIAPFICGTLGQQVGWHVGFGAAGVGMTIALITYLALGQRTLGDIGKSVPQPAPRQTRMKLMRTVSSAIGTIAVILVVLQLTGNYRATYLIVFLTLVAVLTPLFYFWYIFRNPQLTTVERSRMKAYIWIFIGAVMFWMIFDQAGSMLNLFAENNTSRMLGSFEFPASWLQSVDPVGIIIFAPVFALLWLKLGRRAPSLPAKFALAIALIGGSFLLMGYLSTIAERQLVAWEWLVLVLLIQVVAELLLSPTGLSASTKLAPRGMESQVLALWFLATAVGDALGGQLGQLQEVIGNAGYFTVLGAAAVVLAVIFSTQIKRLRVLMSGVH